MMQFARVAALRGYISFSWLLVRAVNVEFDGNQKRPETTMDPGQVSDNIEVTKETTCSNLLCSQC